MKFNASKPAFVPTRRVVSPSGAIEWEELPSMAAQLAQQLAQPLEAHPADGAPRRVWADTEPSSFDEFAASAPTPLHEPFEGLGVREVRSEQVFQHFFGSPTAR